jgi:hypothetical protein
MPQNPPPKVPYRGVDPNDMTLDEIHDSDILVIEKVYKEVCERRRGRRVDLEDFRRETIERFAEAGFKVDVRTWIGEGDEFVSWELLLEGKIEAKPGEFFDRERQAHEVQHNILGVEEAGRFDANGLWRPA